MKCVFIFHIFNWPKNQSEALTAEVDDPETCILSSATQTKKIASRTTGARGSNPFETSNNILLHICMYNNIYSYK